VDDIEPIRPPLPVRRPEPDEKRRKRRRSEEQKEPPERRDDGEGKGRGIDVYARPVKLTP